VNDIQLLSVKTERWRNLQAARRIPRTLKTRDQILILTSNR